MLKKRLLSFFLITALSCSMLAGCGNTETKDISAESTQVETSSKEVTEYNDYMRFVEIGEDVTPIDDEILNADVEMDDEIHKIKTDFSLQIPESVDVYNSNGFYIGYTKKNITVGVVAQNDNWTWIDSQDGGLYIKTPALKSAKVIENEEKEGEVVASTENLDPSTGLPIYELTQTMYAKEKADARSGPDNSYKVIGSLTKNQEVAVTGKAETGWYRIDVDGTTMFVDDSYLSDTKGKEESAKENTAKSDNTTKQETSNNVAQNTASSSDETGDTTPTVEEPATPAEEVTTPVEQTTSLPDVNSTLNDIVSAIRNSYGCVTIPEIYPDETDYISGMSWFEGRVATATYQSDIDGIASNYDGCEVYWIEYSYTDGNDIVFRCYWG